MSTFKARLGCGDATCEARIVAMLMEPDDEARIDPCPRCLAAVETALRHWRDDKARVVRSAHNVIVGRL